MRLRLLILLGVVFGVVVAPASAATDAFAVHYEGSYAWHQDWEGGSTGPTAGSYLRTAETLSWVMDVSGSKAGPGEATDVRVKLSAQGTIDEQGSDPNANEHCTMTQATGGGSGDVTVGRNSDGTLNVGLGVPSSVGGDLVVTGNHQNCDEFNGSVLFCDTSSCAGATVCGAVPPVFHDPSFGAALTPGLDQVKDTSRAFDVGGPRATDTVSCANGGTETTKIGITSSVRVNAGGAPLHAPPGGKHIPTIERQKVFAKGDLLPTIFRAEAACGTVALGTTALVWGTTVPGAGGAAAIAGDMMLAGAGPDCAALISRIYDDARIVNDPPRRDYHTIAKPRPVHTPAAMPGCGKEPAAPGGFCAALRADVLAYVKAVRSATADADALEITVDRESGAARAGATAALTLQERTGSRLVNQLQAASKAERTAGAKVARLLATRGVSGSLDATQTAGGIARITRALANRGVKASTLPKSALKPGPIDLVAALKR
jgi:hypothetical protein